MKCFNSNKKNNQHCSKKDCKYWIDLREHNNCCILAARHDQQNFTLEKIGNIFGVTRMRICQIEKIALSKVKDIIKKRST